MNTGRCWLRALTYLPELAVLGIQVGSEHGLSVGEDSIIGREEHAARDAVRVVHVIERVGRHRVKRHRVVGVAVLGTSCLQVQRVLEIQRRVDAVLRARKVVEPRHDLGTARLAHRVRPCTHATDR